MTPYDIVEIYLDSARMWRWRRLSGNGQVILNSNTAFADLADVHMDIATRFGRPWIIAIQQPVDEMDRTVVDIDGNTR